MRLCIEGEELEFSEGCLSVSHLIGIVPRAKVVWVECLNEKAEPVVIRATGWYARILQHEIDHLRGTFFIDRAKLRTLPWTIIRACGRKNQLNKRSGY